MSTVTLFKLLALGAVVLVLAVALCAFDNDDAGDDLCMVSLATLAALLMVWPLAVVGRPGPGISVSYERLLAGPLPPPPKA